MNKVVVTTDKRGVFFGTLVKDEGEVVVLADARNCIYWSKETKGFLGLAATGPLTNSRVGPAVPSLKLVGVTSIATCTPEAVERWEAGPWT